MEELISFMVILDGIFRKLSTTSFA